MLRVRFWDPYPYDTVVPFDWLRLMTLPPHGLPTIATAPWTSVARYAEAIWASCDSWKHASTPTLLCAVTKNAAPMAAAMMPRIATAISTSASVKPDSPLSVRPAECSVLPILAPILAPPYLAQFTICVDRIASDHERWSKQQVGHETVATVRHAPCDFAAVRDCCAELHRESAGSGGTVDVSRSRSARRWLITVVKSTTGDTAPAGPFVFRVNQDNTTVTTITVPKNGSATSGDLAPGTYTLVELDGPAGATIVPNPVTVDANTTVTVHATNTYPDDPTPVPPVIQVSPAEAVAAPAVIVAPQFTGSRGSQRRSRHPLSHGVRASNRCPHSPTGPGRTVSRSRPYHRHHGSLTEDPVVATSDPMRYAADGWHAARPMVSPAHRPR